MTDQELLAALAEKTPDELSEQEIACLRQRLAESTELREVLFSQVQMESYLAAALGRVNFQAEDLVQRARDPGFAAELEGAHGRRPPLVVLGGGRIQETAQPGSEANSRPLTLICPVY